MRTLCVHFVLNQDIENTWWMTCVYFIYICICYLHTRLSIIVISYYYSSQSIAVCDCHLSMQWFVVFFISIIIIGLDLTHLIYFSWNDFFPSLFIFMFAIYDQRETISFWFECKNATLNENKAAFGIIHESWAEIRDFAINFCKM